MALVMKSSGQGYRTVVRQSFDRTTKMLALVALLAVVVPSAAFRAAPRVGLRPQLKTEMHMVQVRMPTGLGLPRAASWMSGALRAIDSYNSELAPRRGKATRDVGGCITVSGKRCV